ncbi:MAG: hypothetical protein K0R83_495 [Caulobacter sp.]|nr:hypothetical protein [Caulobacter sp.]
MLYLQEVAAEVAAVRIGPAAQAYGRVLAVGSFGETPEIGEQGPQAVVGYGGQFLGLQVARDLIEEAPLGLEQGLGLQVLCERLRQGGVVSLGGQVVFRAAHPIFPENFIV